MRFSARSHLGLSLLLLLVLATGPGLYTSFRGAAQAAGPGVRSLITEYTVPTASGGPVEITSWPDGSFWFTEINGNKVGRITPKGVFKEFPIPTSNSNPQGITSGRIDSIGFTEWVGNKIGILTFG
jgi:streptogramin lyase